MYKVGNAIVRIHGDVKKETLEKATQTFIKKVMQQKQKEKKHGT